MIRSHGASARDVPALVEPLGDLHRAPHGKGQTPRGRLLELRGDKRRRRALASFGGLDADDLPGRFLDVGSHAFCRRLRSQAGIGPVELQLFAFERGQTRREGGRIARFQLRIDRPVLDRDEGLDLPFPLADDPQCDRLDTAGREPAPDLLPQQIGDLVPHQAVDDPAGLLCVDQAPVDLARLLHGGEHGLLGDFVEADALENRSRGAGLQGLLQVPGDRLAFPIGIGGQVDSRRLLGRPAQLRERLLLAGQDLIRRFVGIAAVDAEPFLGQVPHVAVGGEHAEVLAQELLERLRLGGRFDDDDVLAGDGHGAEQTAITRPKAQTGRLAQ